MFYKNYVYSKVKKKGGENVIDFHAFILSEKDLLKHYSL